MDIDSFLSNGLSSKDETESQRNLLRYFELLKSSPDGLNVCCGYLESPKARDERGTFLCLQVLEHFLKHGSSDKENLINIKDKIRRSIVLWYGKCSSGEEKIFVKNKTCQILVGIFVEEYPRRWPSFFTDIMQHLNRTSQSGDLYLRMLLAIDSEAVDRHIPRTKEEEDRNTLIKDSMREQCVPTLVESWYQILQLHKDDHPDIVCLCLQVIGLYISWIDISFIINDKFMNLLLAFLSVDVLRESVCDCFLEIVNKGMDPTGKLKLIEMLSSLLEKFGLLHVLECEDLDFVAKVANLLNGMGTQLISAWNKLTKGDNSKELRKQILSAVDSKLPSLLRFLAHDDDDISQAVFDFTHAYLNLLKEVHRPSHDNGNAIQDVLIVVINKMKYDTDHNFDEEGEDEAMFIDFRKQMKVLFENIAKLDRQLVLSVVRLLVAKTISNWQKMPFEEIELAIYCLYLLGETIPAQHLFNNEENFGALQEMISQVLISGVSCHQHSAVKLQYFETVTRYERFFYAQTQHIGPVLASFLDSRGLRSDTPNICSRTSYLLLRFVKALKNQLVPLVGDVLEQLQPLLVVFPPIPNLKTNLSENDKFYLYEAAATLIVCTNAGDERQSQLMTRLLSPVILIFTATFDKLKSGNVDELQAFECAQELQNLVAYASRASKAFNSPQALKNSGCQACFTEALALFLQSLSIPVHRDVVHNGVRQYLHRMIICLGDDLLPFVPVAVSQLLQDCEVRDIQEFIPLINQIVARFKTQISPFLCEVFMPVVNGIFSILNSPADPADTQAARDRQLLHRSYFLFIATLLNNDVYSVIKSQGRDNVQEVLQTILRGVMDLHDPQSQKICFNIFNCLLSAWGTENELNDFAQFIYGSIVPACFEIPLRPEFDFSDAQTMLVLQEIATTLFTLLNKQERSLVVKQIEIQYFSRVQCPANVLQRYCEALAVAKDAKELKSFLKEFYLQLRQS